MHTKALSRSLFMALCLFNGGLARTCRPRTTSLSLSELASSTSVEFISTASTTTASTDISVPNTDTTSADATLTSAAPEIDTTSTSATEDTSIPPPIQTTSTTEFASSITLEATSATSTLTTEDISIPPLQTTSITDPTTTGTIDATSTIDPNPIITSFYLTSSSQNSVNNGRPPLFRYGGGLLEGVYISPPLNQVQWYQQYQLSLEDGTNKLMLNDYYLVVEPSGYVYSGPLDQIPTNMNFITCTSPVREGQAIQCLGGATRTDFVLWTGVLLMLDSSTSTSLPRIAFIGSASL